MRHRFASLDRAYAQRLDEPQYLFLQGREGSVERTLILGRLSELIERVRNSRPVAFEYRIEVAGDEHQLRLEGFV